MTNSSPTFHLTFDLFGSRKTWHLSRMCCACPKNKSLILFLDVLGVKHHETEPTRTPVRYCTPDKMVSRGSRSWGHDGGPRFLSLVFFPVFSSISFVGDGKRTAMSIQTLSRERNQTTRCRLKSSATQRMIVQRRTRFERKYGYNG